MLIKPTGSFILLISYKLLICFADRFIFKKTEKIMQGRISLDFFLTQQKALSSDIKWWEPGDEIPREACFGHSYGH